jgi:hypothetical protein
LAPNIRHLPARDFCENQISRIAKYPLLGYDLQRKIKANSDLLGRFGTISGHGSHPFCQRTDTASRRMGTGDLEL